MSLQSCWSWVVIGLLAGCAQHHDGALLEKANQAYQQQRYSEAIALYEQSRQVNGDDCDSLLREANALQQTGQVDAEERILIKALACDHDNKARKTLVEFYLDHRQPGKAQEHCEFLCTTYSDDASLMNRLGVIYDMQGFHEKAQAMYKRALDKAPADANFQSNYAISLAYMGRYEEAVAILKPLADHVKQRHNLAVVYAFMQRFDDYHDQLRNDLTSQERDNLLQELSPQYNRVRP